MFFLKFGFIQRKDQPVSAWVISHAGPPLSALSMRSVGLSTACGAEMSLPELQLILLPRGSAKYLFSFGEKMKRFILQ